MVCFQFKLWWMAQRIGEEHAGVIGIDFNKDRLLDLNEDMMQSEQQALDAPATKEDLETGSLGQQDGMGSESSKPYGGQNKLFVYVQRNGDDD
ncbi:hypothetical protein PVAP13_1NG294619 [Panicum virgatum]|uniref:Uncharacterized protein n=1 Tax=Panicum virgatum TaxID=38727 RepID=A0A8T0X2S7_PANVG|nr:hypothetical protein PVAP13_1NG294619 [Panicum virgatum]